MLSEKRQGARKEFLDRIAEKVRRMGAFRMEPLKKGKNNIAAGEFIAEMNNRGIICEPGTVRRIENGESFNLAKIADRTFAD